MTELSPRAAAARRSGPRACGRCIRSRSGGPKHRAASGNVVRKGNTENAEQPGSKDGGAKELWTNPACPKNLSCGFEHSPESAAPVCILAAHPLHLPRLFPPAGRSWREGWPSSEAAEQGDQQAWQIASSIPLSRACAAAMLAARPGIRVLSLQIGCVGCRVGRREIRSIHPGRRERRERARGDIDIQVIVLVVSHSPCTTHMCARAQPQCVRVCLLVQVVASCQYVYTLVLVQGT